MRITLTRLYRGEDCTIGVMQANDGLMCFTMERPWLNNKRNVSCIPVGEYMCRPYSSQKYPEVWEVKSVKDRSKILIHVANVVSDVEGCIGVGATIGELRDEKAGL